MATRERQPLRFAYALSALLSLGALQLSVLGPARGGDFAAGCAFNAATILGWWALFELLAATRVGGRLLAALYYAGLAALCGLVFAHTWCFDVAIERRLTLLDVTSAGLAYFFSVVLPARGFLSLLGLAAALCVGGFALARLLARVHASALRTMAAALLVLSAACSIAPRVASPLFDSAHELWELARLPKIRPQGPADPAQIAVLDKSSRTRGVGAARFTKLVVLVMETMTAQNFARESALLGRETFVQRERTHMHGFERYYPNNQDSRTGMLDMLCSRLIPFEAYSKEGIAGYRHVAREPSLVDRMRELSFASAFAVSQTALEDVVAELGWDRTLQLSAAQIAAAKREGKLCFSPDEYEQSCEDLALLPQVVDFLAEHERAFVYQEFIWGHAYEYNAASGKTNAEYYSGYVDALLAQLAQRGLADQTLLVLTSDHGFRDRGRQHDPEVYRVPLLLHANSFSPRTDQRLLSHSDLGMLIFEALTPEAPAAAENPFVMIVGPTGQGHVFVVGAAGGHLLMRHKAGLDLLVTRQGALPLAPERFLALFQLYRERFSAGGLGR